MATILLVTLSCFLVGFVLTGGPYWLMRLVLDIRHHGWRNDR